MQNDSTFFHVLLYSPSRSRNVEDQLGEGVACQQSITNEMKDKHHKESAALCSCEGVGIQITHGSDTSSLLFTSFSSPPLC